MILLQPCTTLDFIIHIRHRTTVAEQKHNIVDLAKTSQQAKGNDNKV